MSEPPPFVVDSEDESSRSPTRLSSTSSTLSREESDGDRIRASPIATRPRSALWSHVTLLNTPAPNGSARSRMYECKHCQRRVSVTTVSNVEQHLRVRHRSVERSAPFVASSQRTLHVDRSSYLNVIRGVHRVVMNFAVQLKPFSEVNCPTFRALADHMPVHDRRALRKSTVELAKELKHKFLLKKKGGHCSIGVDGGKVFNSYMAVAIAFPGESPILHCMERYSDIAETEGPQKGSVTSASVGKFLTKVTSELKGEYDITTTAVCADNAAVMQAENAHVKDVLHVRCGAHITNLVAQDVKEGTWIGEVYNRAVAIRAEADASIRLPKMVLTRWNCLLRLIEDILKKHADPKFDFSISEDDEALFTRGVENLRPLLVLTDRMQSDSSTLFDALVGMSSLLEASSFDNDFGNMMEVSIKNPNRECMFKQDYLLMLTLLCPGCERFNLNQELRDKCLSLLLASKALFSPSATEAAIASEFNNLIRAGRDAPMGPVDIDSYRNYWSERKGEYPNLFHAVERLLTIIPSEAAVERVFSIVKRCLTMFRKSMHDDVLVAQVQLKTLYHALWNRSGLYQKVSQESASDSDDEPNIVEESLRKNTMTQTLLNTLVGYFNTTVVPKRLSLHTPNTCKYCSEKIYNHKDGREKRYVVCCKCKGVVSVACVGCAPGDEAELAQRTDWKCRNCVVGN